MGENMTQDERTTLDAAVTAWEEKGPTSLTVALLADAVYGARDELAELRAKVARVEAARNAWAEELASGAIRDNGARYCWGQAVREVDDALAGPEPDMTED